MESSAGITPDFAEKGEHASLLAARQRRSRSAAGTLLTRELSPGKFLGFAALVCVSIWAIVWAYIVFFPMAYLDRNYPLAIAKAQLTAACPANDIAVFGDSRTVAAIMPQEMQLRVTNLGYPGASPVEDYFLVQRLLRCPTPPRLVVLAQSAALYVGPHAFWDIFAHIGILNEAELAQVQAEGNRLHDDELYRMPHPTGVPYALLPELFGMKFPPLYFSSLLGGYGFARGHFNQVMLQQIKTASGQTLFGNVQGSDDLSDEAHMADWSVTPLTNEYLLRTLALLRSHHVPVALITMPVNDATCKVMPAQLQIRLAAYLKNITQNDPNVLMANAQITCWPDRDFTDNAHFNQEGAVAYSKVFEIQMRQALNSLSVKAAAND